VVLSRLHHALQEGHDVTRWEAITTVVKNPVDEKTWVEKERWDFFVSADALMDEEREELEHYLQLMDGQQQILSALGARNWDDLLFDLEMDRTDLAHELLARRLVPATELWKFKTEEEIALHFGQLPQARRTDKTPLRGADILSFKMTVWPEGNRFTAEEELRVSQVLGFHPVDVRRKYYL
jgi:hypothetical protein